MKRPKPIAVVGMAGVFPGASDLNTYWHNIVNKVDSTKDVSHSRWIVDPDVMVDGEPKPDKAYSKRCCLIENFEFDPDGFNLRKDLIQALDPLYHIVLHAGRVALSNLLNTSVNRERTGVILAAIALPSETTSLITREVLGSAVKKQLFPDAASTQIQRTNHKLNRNQYFASRVTSLPAAIIARSFGLGGGTYTLDAACASSLYAVKLACDELNAHRTDAMLAGGVSRPDCLFTQVGFSQLKALSPSGRCSPFDESADGLVVGEGAGLFLLKRIEDALRDQDPIQGLITGIGLSNDLRGNLLAPDSEGQVRAMRRAYECAGWSPQDIDLIECHGAGTPLGDLTELHSLKKLWGVSNWELHQCAIGSVKSMIGHLLTAAGAAGMMKTLLALQNKILPPSLNFKKAPRNSPLHDGPFRVQSVPQDWHRRNDDLPRRAAVSAFGFGGINAHLLLEEWCPNVNRALPTADAIQSSTLKINTPAHQIKDNGNAGDQTSTTDIAIVGMETTFGESKSLRDFQEFIFNGTSTIRERPASRWKGCDHLMDRYSTNAMLTGGFMKTLGVAAGEFHIPPNEIPDILPQQLLMLKVGARAMMDAGLTSRKERPQMGTIIGIDFDFEATNFHLRWHLNNWIPSWLNTFGLKPDAEKIASWMESLKNTCSPPLTATRTLGSIGSIVASRLAREFRFGAPSFVVSCEAASALKALEIGVNALQQHEADAFLIGAVDLRGDIRNIILANQLNAFSPNRKICPFDRSSDGTLPGEGAAAVIIKRLEQAIDDGDRIYAVIKGSGSASGGGIQTDIVSAEAYQRSLEGCFRSAHIKPQSISYFEAHGSGNSEEDNLEAKTLNAVFVNQIQSCAVGSVKSTIGHTGAVSGLASVVKTCLCLYHEVVPPLTNFTTPTLPSWKKETFHFPQLAQFWTRNRQNGPRKAVVGSMTADGNCMHVILEGYDYDYTKQDPPKIQNVVQWERKRPLGFHKSGLLVVEGDTQKDLVDGLQGLLEHLEKFKPKGTDGGFSTADDTVEHAAHVWHLKNGIQPSKSHAVSLIGDDFLQLKRWIQDAQKTILTDKPLRFKRTGGVTYSPNPLGRSGELAFVFPGSGNHYLGMGRGLGVYWPQILHEMDARTLWLEAQLLPEYYVPWRVSWEPGWQKDADDEITADPLRMIFGQVVHGGVVTNLMRHFGIHPSAVIGYSLGESTGYFAMGVWPERDEMLKRMLQTDLFTTELAGSCNAARQAWGIPPEKDVNWTVAVVNRSANAVGKIIDRYPFIRLLIINTQNECVIGGCLHEVKAAIKDLKCDAIFLNGVVTVHCDALKPVADAYRELHEFPTRQLEDIRFYSCALGRSYRVSREKTANSILSQALHGFDFTKCIHQAYRDGVRIFLEIGPYSSCTRMIDSILKETPHLALSACVRGEDDYITVLKVLGNLIAERIPVDLNQLYGSQAFAPAMIAPLKDVTERQIEIAIGATALSPIRPYLDYVRPGPADKEHMIEEEPNRQLDIQTTKPRNQELAVKDRRTDDRDPRMQTIDRQSPPNLSVSTLIEAARQSTEITSNVHQKFLEFSNELTRNFAQTFELQTRLFEQALLASPESIPPSDFQNPISLPKYTREQCLEFAKGSAAAVLGTDFAVVDTYRARVRLPDEPLMLVDRILSVEGEKGSLESGRIITEHDVLPGAWYLDGDHAPVCISVEAGQADLFLSAYLGIDLKVKGLRTYRLLDATVKFHRELPRPNETIRYEIEIEKFMRQGDTYLFLFHFDGFIGDTPLITMTNGCAGFFTEEEVRKSGGIILSQEDLQQIPGKRPSDWKDLVPLHNETYDDASLEALRTGNLEIGFGETFKGISLPDSLKLPGGRMKLIDRIVKFAPAGGRFGLGLIQAEADIHPDDWFLTCHFVDDMVMPGTLMYECCAHTLRVFLQRLGWVTERLDVFYGPVMGVESTLRCRGPVTPQTQKVIYEIEIKEMGYKPEPYAIADAHMYADDHRIVFFRNMSLQMYGITGDEIVSFWKNKESQQSPGQGELHKSAGFD
ncbi:MAG: beta-ketoacyl synthase N-terminal-like domain-containing protein, partial [Desulfobacterales bacterium]